VNRNGGELPLSLALAEFARHLIGLRQIGVACTISRVASPASRGTTRALIKAEGYMTIKFARCLFLGAGIYGMAVITPMFFLETLIGEYDPPSITHAEFYYGFVCTAFAWQLVYLMMFRDPLRLRPMLIPAILGKAGFAISVLVLFAQGRLKAQNLILPSIDLVLAALFAWAYIALRSYPHPEQVQLPGPGGE
jgi:hypothetical protein